MSSGNTLGDKLAGHCGFDPVPLPKISLKTIEQLRKIDTPSWESDNPYSHSLRNMGQPRRPRTYTATEVGRLLGVPVRTVADWRRRGQIPAEVAYGICGYLADEIDRMIAQGTLPPAVTRTYTPAEIGKMLGVSSHVVGDWRHRGFIPKDIVYGKKGYLADEIDRMIADGTLPPTKPVIPSITSVKSSSAPEAVDVPEVVEQEPVTETKPVMTKFYNAKEAAEAISKHTGAPCAAKYVASWRRHGYIPKEATGSDGEYIKSVIDRMIANGDLPPKVKFPRPSQEGKQKRAYRRKEDTVQADVTSSVKTTGAKVGRPPSVSGTASTVSQNIVRICDAVETSVKHTGLIITSISFDSEYNVEHVLLEIGKKYQ